MITLVIPIDYFMTFTPMLYFTIIILTVNYYIYTNYHINSTIVTIIINIIVIF